MSKGNEWWRYENLESGAPYDWSPAERGGHPDDNIDFHLDLGCGTLKKARLGIDRFEHEAVDIVMDLDALYLGGTEYNDEAKLRQLVNFQGRLPFPADSIESIVSHHCLEHIGDGFIRLIDECHRVLVPGGKLRIITPLFPSRAAVEDPDHKRWIMEGTFDSFCGTAEGQCWLEGFSVPYTQSRFKMAHKDITKRLEDPAEWWGPDDAREIRVTLQKHDQSERTPSAPDSQE